MPDMRLRYNYDNRCRRREYGQRRPPDIDRSHDFGAPLAGRFGALRKLQNCDRILPMTGADPGAGKME
jgi:hypothetical protein